MRKVFTPRNGSIGLVTAAVAMAVLYVRDTYYSQLSTTSYVTTETIRTYSGGDWSTAAALLAIVGLMAGASFFFGYLVEAHKI